MNLVTRDMLFFGFVGEWMIFAAKDFDLVTRVDHSKGCKKRLFFTAPPGPFCIDL
jgi:hypothetical protein